MNSHKVKPISVAEKIRKKAAMMRKYERLGIPQSSKMENNEGIDEISQVDNINSENHSRKVSVENSSKRRGNQSSSAERETQELRVKKGSNGFMQP